MKSLKMFAVLLVLCVTGLSYSGTDSTQVVAERVAEIKGAVEGMNESMLEMKSTVDALKKIKVTGYLQAQYQTAESEGAKSFSGGDFPKTADNRLGVRRGRVKFTYDNTISQMVIQLDATEKGVGIKDAYLSFKDPWMQTFGLTAGVFDRPFGFEISYSSSSRETPERSRLFQTLFPGERDLGFKLDITPTKGLLQYFNFKGGLFAGNGVAAETDSKQDFIGRLGFQLPLTSVNLALDGGLSLYRGNVRLDDATKDANGNPVIYSTFKLDSPTSFATETAQFVERKYVGGDLQLYYDLPVIGGFSLRGEYIAGEQPGSKSASTFYKAGGGDIYLRNFSGYYLCYVQNVGSRNQFVAKYDSYDPNSDVAAGDFGKGNSKLGAADLKYDTMGLGWIYHWDANVKLVFYYDMVKNETTSAVKGFETDLKDDVFTFRVQYKF
ncbi:MAG: porin [Calditrichaeota bacterium]|nr:MAG: porin [Calditrichota bacterium]